MKQSLLVLLAALAVSAAGCKGLLKKREPDPAASAAPAAPPVPVATPAPAVEPPKAVAEDGIPTPEDFEDEAFEKVTQANYAAELERLKKDISAK